MNAPSVTQAEIATILESSEVQVSTIFDKVTLVSVKLPNGFVLTASSGAVSKDNYDEKIGSEICLKQVEDELWKLEGYALQKRIAETLPPSSALPPHQARVVDEKLDLDDRLVKLTKFITESKIFASLDDEDRLRLVQQRSAMSDYSEILGERIAAF